MLYRVFFRCLSAEYCKCFEDMGEAKAFAASVKGKLQIG